MGDDRHLAVHAGTSEEFDFEDGMSRNSSHTEWYVPLLREFSARIRSGDRATAPLEEAIHVTRLLARVYESAACALTLPFDVANTASASAAGGRPC